MTEVKNRNDEDFGKIRSIANSGEDGPVLMLNLNLYSEDADFPHGKLYTNYMTVLERFLPSVGARISGDILFWANQWANKSCTRYWLHGIQHIRRSWTCQRPRDQKKIFASEDWLSNMP